MILAMRKARRHFAVRGSGAELAVASGRCTVVALAALFLAASAWPQSPGNPKTPRPAVSSSKPAAPTASRPDKHRAQNAFQSARRAEQSGDWKTAYADYTKASASAPANREYSVLREHAQFQLIQKMLDAAERQELAGETEKARALLLEAQKLDPNYTVTRERLEELTSDSPAAVQDKPPRLAGLPQLQFKPGTHDFDYRGTMRGAYDEIGRQFGVTMVFDGDLPDRAVRFRAPKMDFETAVMILSRQTDTFTRVADEHTLFITEDTPQKVREYAPEIEKTLSLPDAVTPDDMNETVRMIRQITGISRTQLNTAAHTLTVRSTEQNVELAQALLKQIEQPRGELMLEIEILELNRDAAHRLGITPPSSSTLFALSSSEIQQLQAAQNNGTLLQVIQSIFGSGSALGAAGGLGSVLPPLIAFGGGKSIFLATVPGATANFSQALSTVRSARRILLRAQDGKPATFFVGDRYPVDLALLSSNVNSPSSTLSAGLLTGLTLPRKDYATGSSPIALALGDFNGDGLQDMVVANQSDGTISILNGAGDGTFATGTPITLPAGTSAPAPSAVVTGDFDGDANLDIAVADSANSSVSILLGNGDGTFAAPLTFPAGENPVALLAKDLNGDGILDLAIVNQGTGATNGTVSIWLGHADITGTWDQTFSPMTDYPVGTLPTAIASSDFNADGRPDLAVPDFADNTVSILLQSNDGTAATQGTFAAKVDYSTGGGPAGIVVADLNADGRPDLAVTNQTDNSVSILLGNSDGTFNASTDFPTGTAPTGILAADFTGAGPLDLAVADRTDNNADILVGNGDGTFSTPIPIPTGNAPVAVASADLNGDGTQDLMTANQSSNSITVTLNTLQSSLASAAQIGYPSAEYVDLGLKVKATPRMHGDDEVTLQLEFDIRSLAGSSVNGIPILNNRTVEQTIRLRENETSVLSGIIHSDEARSVSGVPWTSTSPGVGLLTGENTADNQRTEMLIVITPRALRLPPHQVPAIYAGRGEPSTPPAPPQPPPAAPPGTAQPPEGAQPGQRPGAPPAPTQSPQPPLGAQPGQRPGAPPGRFPGGPFQQRPPN